VLDVSAGMITTRDTRVQARRQQVGQSPKRCGRRVDPGKETRTAVAHGVAQDLRGHFVEKRIGIGRALRQRLAHQLLPQFLGYRLAARLLRQRGEVLREQIHGAIAQAAEFLGVKIDRCADSTINFRFHGDQVSSRHAMSQNIHS